ncbi:hypothetical protein NXY55_08960 [Aeromonas veronii]|nr:hypothetical protein [Aeromonas veronii]
MKILFGLVVGFILAILIILFYMRFELDSSLLVNIAIAFGTCIGTAVVTVAFYEGKKNREWEIRKEPLLRLLAALSDALDVTGSSSDFEFEKMTGENIGAEKNIDYTPYKKLKLEINYLLKVHRPLFPEKVMIAIKDYLDKEVAIDKAVDNQEKSILEAYDSLYNEQEKLHGILIGYVKEIARI